MAGTGRRRRMEALKRAPRLADLQVAKMTPIDLHLLARQRAQPQISLGRRARALGADRVAEVAALLGVAKLAHPVEEPAGRQRGVLLKGLPDAVAVPLDQTACAAAHPGVRCPARARPGARCRGAGAGAGAIGSRWSTRANARPRTDAGPARPGQGKWSCRPPGATLRRRSQPSRKWGSTTQPHRRHLGAAHAGAVAAALATTATATIAAGSTTTSAAEPGCSIGSQALLGWHAGSEASAGMGRQPWCVTLLALAPALLRRGKRRRRRQQAMRAACLSLPGRLLW